MKARDDLKEVIEALRDRHSLLAAYLEAAGGVNQRALHKPMSLGITADHGGEEQPKASGKGTP